MAGEYVNKSGIISLYIYQTLRFVLKPLLFLQSRINLGSELFVIARKPLIDSINQPKFYLAKDKDACKDPKRNNKTCNFRKTIVSVLLKEKV